jgi:hypothetical protein
MTQFRTKNPFSRSLRRLTAALLAMALWLGAFAGAQAQSAARADLYAPNVSAFPNISAQLDVFDASGLFVSGLQPGAVS